jgi:DNA-binding transcriptional MocR family regulator
MWIPDVGKATDLPLYREIVQRLLADIEAGVLSTGARLPPHRDLADRLGVARGTVARAYAEAERLGIVQGSVGRGTFVTDPRGKDGRYRSVFAPAPDGIDLSLNYPDHGQDPELGPALARLARRSDLQSLLRYQPQRGAERHRALGLAWASRHQVEADLEQIAVCAGAQHAMLVALATAARPGDTVLVEEWTYPGIFAAAATLGLRVQPVACDLHGIKPGALQAICEQRKARVLCTIPTIHNPTTSVLPLERRKRIAAIARASDLALIEDDVLRLRVPDAPPPLQSLAPERTYFIASTSKAICGGLRVAFLVAPPSQMELVAERIWGSLWMASALGAELIAGWIESGVADTVLERRRRAASARQQLADRILQDRPRQSHPASDHVWLHLPAPWTTDQFVAEARQRGVTVAPAHVFTPVTRREPRVRLSLSAARSDGELRHALHLLRDLLDRRPLRRPQP